MNSPSASLLSGVSILTIAIFQVPLSTDLRPLLLTTFSSILRFGFFLLGRTKTHDGRAPVLLKNLCSDEPRTIGQGFHLATGGGTRARHHTAVGTWIEMIW